MTTMINQIGLPKNESVKITEQLNILLAQYQMHYQNLRSFHWNIRGRHFFELHTKFEEYYTDAQEKIDMIAERVLTLGGTPLHTFKAYLEENQLEVANNVSDGEMAVQNIVDSLNIILRLERVVLNLSDEVGDDGTSDLLSPFISQQEKEIWMLNAWLNNG